MTCGFNDFDFLIGEWKVHHRQLKSHLPPCKAWHEFTGRSEARKILGGFGVMDENIVFEPRGTYRSAWLCTFDTTANCWSIWWYDGRSPTQLAPPAIGKFDDHVGTFVGPSIIDGTPVDIRYTWTLQDNGPRCEQALSINRGRTWEVHWIMDFRKIS